MRSNRISLKVGDLLIILVIIALSVALFAASNGEKNASFVTIESESGQSSYSLFEDREIELSSNGCNLLIVIKDGKVSVKSSDCPDKVCVASGEISDSGRVIACVPARVTVKVEARNDDEIDWVAP